MDVITFLQAFKQRKTLLVKSIPLGSSSGLNRVQLGIAVVLPLVPKMDFTLNRAQGQSKLHFEGKFMFSTELDFSNDQPPLAENITISSETPTDFLPGAQMLLLGRVCSGRGGSLWDPPPLSFSAALLAPARRRGRCHTLGHCNRPTRTG